MWQDVLGIRPIGVRDNFFELGGHSLLAVRLVAQIQQRFDKALSLVSLFQEPTIEHVARLLRQQDKAEPLPSLVPLKSSGSRRPLFFIHPSGGSVHWYADLATVLDPEQPFYGLQAQGLYGDAEIHTEIEEMAAHYIREMRTVQPEGPYMVGSWSMGVIIAFEVAQQLVAQGQEVALLAMLDQGPDVPGKEPEDDAEYLIEFFGKRLPLSLDDLRQLDFEEQVAYVMEEAKRIHWLSPDITFPQFRHFVHILKTHAQAWRRYEPKTYPGRITLFRTDNQPAQVSQEPDLGWGRLAAGGVEIHEVPGDHNSMLHDPHVQTLAERLMACLDGAINTSE